MGHNMVKSNSPNAPSTWLFFLCPVPSFPTELASVMLLMFSLFTLVAEILQRLCSENPYLSIKLYHVYVCCMDVTFIYSIQYYPWFHITAIGLGMLLFSNATTCPSWTSWSPSWLWLKCNWLPRLERPWGVVTLSQWGGWWYMNMEYQEGP
jgi:hypothetical protein